MLELKLDERENVAVQDWYTLHSGRCCVGVLRRQADAWRKPFWYFTFNAMHVLTTGIETHGSSKTLDGCFAHANRCWADHLEALGLQPTPEQAKKSPLLTGVPENGPEPPDA